MSAFWEATVTILGGVAAVAMLSVLMSRKSQTPAVVQAFGSAYSNALGVAEAPVTGAATSLNLTYPGMDTSNQFGYGG